MRIPFFLSIFLIPICSILAGFSIFLVSGQCLDDQKELLLKLNNSLEFDIASSTKLRRWNQSLDCCQWKGVNCSSEGRVTGLDLSNESISGGLDNSRSLFSLQYLQNLSLAYNKFNYSLIPSGLGKLTNLRNLNLSKAGFAGQIPIEISRLRRLVILDLSALYFPGDSTLKLENPKLKMLVQNFTELTELHLDGVNISEQGNEWCEALSSSVSNLTVLSMSNCNLLGPLNPSLLKLQSLSSIRLDNNNLSATVPDFFASFTNLTSLRLSSSGLFHTFPDKIFQVPALEVLDLSNNLRLGGSLPDFPQNGHLRTLVLSHTNFSGKLPHSIGKLTMLSRMDFSSCNFSGPIPTTMANLTQLLYLDMSSNNFTGPIPSFSKAKNLTQINLSRNDLTGQITSTHWQELKNLVNLDLGYNFLNGSIPVSLFSHLAMRYLRLSNNQFFGELNQFPNISSNVLEYLDLSSNNLEGAIPVSVFNFRGLKILSLSSNNFNGSFKLNMIEQLKNLSSLDLSYNNLSIEYDRTGSPSPSFPNITTLKLASSKLKIFPDFLRTQSRLTVLDLSDNDIGGKIPHWIWKLTFLPQLNLSFNNLVTLEGFPRNASDLTILDIRSNRLQGQLPDLPKFATYLDFSKNNFSSIIPSDVGDFLSYAYFFSLSSNKFKGSIPVSICYAAYLRVLDLSTNSFGGTIPECLLGMDTLGVLNLGRNNLQGTIPDTFPDNCGLKTLDLNGNQLIGKLPKSLENCTGLEVFDIGNNHIEDIFPCHLKNASVLRVLVLRSNKFSGPLGCRGHNATWPMLQILDVASNNFTGTLPIKCFYTWTAMLKSEDDAESELNHLRFKVLGFGNFYYQDAVTVTFKGLSMELVKILTLFTSIDVSCNNLKGPIPEAVGGLSLYVLNLSHNAFSGHIPTSLANLTQLESLDFSSNQLTGKIPTQLAENLIFLSALNLSFNQLVGPIPLIKQFTTFLESSYEGNKGLCGFPLKKICNAGRTPQSAAPKSPETTSHRLIGFDWQFILTGLGFGVGAALFVAPLMYWEKGRRWYNESTDKIILVILTMIGLSYTGSKDDKLEAEEDIEDDSIEDYDDEDETEDEEFRGRYCVFCSKLDISRKRVIHDPKCICRSSPLISSSSSTSSSSS